MNSFISKAMGCLAGVAVGDALGRATEFMTQPQIRARFGWLDHWASPTNLHPGHADPWGTITDDTIQTLILARLLVRRAPLTAESVAEAFVTWARASNGLSDSYLGPSTRRALTQLMEGASPYETGRRGTTNGASMRVAAIGIVHVGNLDGALRDAVAASIPTHNTHNGIQGAAAVACAIAQAMLPDSTLEAVIAAAQSGARRGREFGEWSWATPLEKRIELAVRLVNESNDLTHALSSLYDYVGVGLDPAESVATAMGIAVAARGDPMLAILAGVNIGGDTDTIASIAGSVCGAMRGIERLDPGLVREVEQVNHLDFSHIASELAQ